MYITIIIIIIIIIILSPFWDIITSAKIVQPYKQAQQSGFFYIFF